MSIDLGLEYLQINKPSGSLFEIYNEYTIAYDEVMDASYRLSKALEAFDNLYNLKCVINEYGRTRSLEAFVGSEVIASCEAEESWIKRAWEAIKNLWDKIKSWFVKSKQTTESTIKKAEAVEEQLKKHEHKEPLALPEHVGEYRKHDKKSSDGTITYTAFTEKYQKLIYHACGTNVEKYIHSVTSL